MLQCQLDRYKSGARPMAVVDTALGQIVFFDSGFPSSHLAIVVYWVALLHYGHL